MQSIATCNVLDTYYFSKLLMTNMRLICLELVETCDQKIQVGFEQ